MRATGGQTRRQALLGAAGLLWRLRGSSVTTALPGLAAVNLQRLRLLLVHTLAARMPVKVWQSSGSLVHIPRYLPHVGLLPGYQCNDQVPAQLACPQPNLPTTASFHPPPVCRRDLPGT